MLWVSCQQVALQPAPAFYDLVYNNHMARLCGLMTCQRLASWLLYPSSSLLLQSWHLCTKFPQHMEEGVLPTALSPPSQVPLKTARSRSCAASSTEAHLAWNGDVGGGTPPSNSLDPQPGNACQGGGLAPVQQPPGGGRTQAWIYGTCIVTTSDVSVG